MLVIELVCWCVGCGSGLSGISRGVGEKNKMRWKVRVSSAVCVPSRTCIRKTLSIRQVCVKRFSMTHSREYVLPCETDSTVYETRVRHALALGSEALVTQTFTETQHTIIRRLCFLAKPEIFQVTLSRLDCSSLRQLMF